MTNEEMSVNLRAESHGSSYHFELTPLLCTFNHWLDTLTRFYRFK